jgi:phosphotransacetylase
MDLPCHVLHETINARGIVDMTALAVVEAQGTVKQELLL